MRLGRKKEQHSMKRDKLLKRVREEAGVEASLSAVDQIVRAFCLLVQSETLATGRCQVSGLGVFSLQQRAARVALDFGTGERREFPARRCGARRAAKRTGERWFGEP
jgi:nucleoid DNA-binding protein